LVTPPNNTLEWQAFERSNANAYRLSAAASGVKYGYTGTMPIPPAKSLITYSEIILSEISELGVRKALVTFRKVPHLPRTTLPVHQQRRLYRRINASEVEEWRGAVRIAWSRDTIHEC
jgi:hypothetical protein